jgi:subtilase family serine protease
MRMRTRRNVSVTARVASLSVLVATAALGLTTAANASPLPPARHQVATMPTWVKTAHRVGTPASSSQHDVLVMLAGQDPAGLTALAQSVNDPSSAAYRHFITPAQYAARFAPTAATVDAATSWLAGQGLKVTGRDVQNAYLQVSGTTSRLDAAFGTSLNTYTLAGRTVMAPATAVSVPGAVSGQITGVVGLNTAPVPATQHVLTDQALGDAQQQQQVAKAAVTGLSATSGATASAGESAAHSGGLSAPIGGQTLGCSQYYGEQTASDLPAASDSATKTTPPAYVCGYTPAQLQQAFGVGGSGSSGQGVTIGITMWCDPDALAASAGLQSFEADLSQWAGLVGAQPWKSGQYSTLAPAGGYDATLCPDDNARLEQALDVESLHAIAPDARIVVSSAASPSDAALITALHALVDTRKTDIISDSWGELESSEDPATMAAYDQVFQQAAAEGISVLFGSGDDGDNTGVTGSAQPFFPGDDPWVTSVGGTADGIGKNNALTFTDAWFTSAKLEVENAFGPTGVATIYEYAGGGGVSTSYAEPWYQTGVVPRSLAQTPARRVYPDLSNIASPETPFRLGLTDGGLLGDNFALSGIGGTSLATPVTAAELADTIQKYGRPLGFINPTLYAAPPGGLTDISSNSPGHAVALPLLGGVFGVEQLTEGAQSESFGEDGNPDDTADYLQPVTTTLSVGPGYDDLTGLGAVTDFRSFAKELSGRH